MKILANPSATMEILDKFGFSFKKKYGQNFLIDENTVRKIVKLSGVTKCDTVLEIGPGIGTMTQILSEEAGKVIAVEIDAKLIEVLEYTLSDRENVEIINRDILKCDLKELSKDHNSGKGFRLVANLPYYITTPIIMGLLEENAAQGNSMIESMTVMIQKEVASRINAKPGTKDYGALSLAVEYYTVPELLMDVSANVFIPRPNVDSSVIGLKIREKPPVKVKDESKMFSLIRAAFAQRRKTFVNSVSAVLGIDKDILRNALVSIGRDENVRGEVLSLDEFAGITDIV